MVQNQMNGTMMMKMMMMIFSVSNNKCSDMVLKLL